VRVEDRCIGRYHSARCRFAELVSSCHVHQTRCVAIKDPAASNERRPNRALDILKRPEQPVDRTAGCAFGSLIDGNCKEATITPVAAYGERITVSLPFIEICVDILQQHMFVALFESL